MRYVSTTVVLLCILALAPTAYALTYTFTILGAAGSDSIANAINDSGQVVGYSGTSALLWQGGTTSTIGNFQPSDINNNGQVSGIASVAGHSHAVMWQSGKLSDFGAGWAYGINSSGQIAGAVFVGPSTQACVWQNGIAVRLLGLAGYSNAVDINDNGDVAGWATVQAVYSAAVWKNGTATCILPGVYSEADAISNDGTVVGSPGFMWQDGVATYLPRVSGRPSGRAGCCAINGRGQIVGYSDVLGGDTRACLWQNGTVVDLGPTDCLDSVATGINSSGVIVGRFYDRVDKHYRAAMWTPVPEPSSFLVVLSAIAGTGVICRRRR